jgi:TIR domain
MPLIFVSYRRDDSASIVGRLADKLWEEFGSRQVFMDVDAIPLGMDFRNVLEEAVRKAEVMLVLIGPNWVSSFDHDGLRRLDNPNDFVRMEIEYALRANLRVIPVMLEHAHMPRAEELPLSLRQLTRRHGLSLSSTSFRRDCESIINTLREGTALSPAAIPSSLPLPPALASIAGELVHSTQPPARTAHWKLMLLSKFASLLGLQSAVTGPDLGSAHPAVPAAPSHFALSSVDTLTNTRDEVFMSYSRDDTPVMRKVREWLGRSEISVWTDEKLVPGTPSWKKAVEIAIESSNCFIILLTPNAKKSNIVEMELTYALAQERIILPVLAVGTNRTAVPLDIINRQWTDIRDEFETGMTRLAEAIITYRSATSAGLSSAALIR